MTITSKDTIPSGITISPVNLTSGVPYGHIFTDLMYMCSLVKMISTKLSALTITLAILRDAMSIVTTSALS